MHTNRKQNVCSKCFLLSDQHIKAISFDVNEMSLTEKVDQRSVLDFPSKRECLKNKKNKNRERKRKLSF